MNPADLKKIQEFLIEEAALDFAGPCCNETSVDVTDARQRSPE